MKPEVLPKAQKSWEAGTLSPWNVGLQVCAEPSRELWAGKCLHQKAPFTLAFSNVKCLGLLTCFFLLCTDIPSDPSLRKSLWVAGCGAVCQIRP